MTTTTTSGVFSNKHKAELAINDLKDKGVSDKEISCVYTDKDGDMKDSQSGEKVGGGAVSGATTGAVIGTIAGLVVANGLLPGLGTLFVAGPLAATLGFTGAVATTVAGAATGVAAGGLIGALSKLGVSNEDAELYEKHIQGGEALIVCRSEEDDVMEVFRKHDAVEVRQYNS